MEAEAKVTKLLDSCFYSIARLFPEVDEESEKGGSPPKELDKGGSAKGEGSPKSSPQDRKTRGKSSEKEEGEKKSKEVKPKQEETGKKDSKPKEVHQSEEKKALPRKREEEKPKRDRSRTPKHEKEKDKRKKRRGDSKSRSISGSVVRRKKREDFVSQKAEREEVETAAKPSSGIQREAYLRPRPSQREPRSPRTPDHPPPRVARAPAGGGRGSSQGQGWRGPIPYSYHPRWTQSTNKGVTKRAKQELHERKQNRGRW